jgi:hypothetical protein
MASVNVTFYYYLILFATFLICASFIPIIYTMISENIVSNIPYVSLSLMLISFLIFLYITIERKYYIHVGLYLIGFLSISFILFFKIKNNIINSESE